MTRDISVYLCLPVYRITFRNREFISHICYIFTYNSGRKNILHKCEANVHTCEKIVILFCSRNWYFLFTDAACMRRDFNYYFLQNYYYLNVSFLFLSRFFQSLHVIKKSCSVQGTYKRKMSTVSSTASNAGHTYRCPRYKVYGNPRCWEDCRREASGIFCQAHGDDCNILA